MTDPTRDDRATGHHFGGTDEPLEDEYAQHQREQADKPCPCWQQVSLHSGHCCMRDVPADHEPGEPLPCGHTDPREDGDG